MSQNRKNWSIQEDEAMMALVKRYGSKKWSIISDKMRQKCMDQGRTGKQCRERWYNHLCPKINKQPWSEAEIKNLFQLHQKLGNRWTQIASHLKGRTDNSVKNQYYSTLRKGLRRMYRILGSQNSTTRIKKMKPKELSDLISNFNSVNIQDQLHANQFYAILFQLANEQKYSDLQSGVLEDRERDRLINSMEKFVGVKEKCKKPACKRNYLKKNKDIQSEIKEQIIEQESIQNLSDHKQSNEGKDSDQKFDFSIDLQSSENWNSPQSSQKHGIRELDCTDLLQDYNTFQCENLNWKQKKDSLIELQEQDCLTKMLKKSSYNEKNGKNKSHINQCQQNLFQCFFAASPVAGLQLRAPLVSKMNNKSGNQKNSQCLNDADRQLNQILRQVKNQVSHKQKRIQNR